MSEAPNLEAALARLEQIIDEIEGGDLELEEALAKFEEGVALLRAAGRTLDAADVRVQQLLADGDSWRLHPFRPAE